MKKNKKIMIGVLAILILALGVALLKTYSLYSPHVASEYLKKTSQLTIDNKTSYKSEVENAWVKYYIKLDLKKDLNINNSFNNFNKDDKLKFKNKVFNIFKHTHYQVCNNKKAEEAIKKNIGIEVLYEVEDSTKNIGTFKVDVIPFTCKEMKKVRDLEKKFNKKREERLNEKK